MGGMDRNELQKRAQLARRLKAARWLAGDVRASDTGKSGYEVFALTAEELAAREGMADNKITASTIGRIERLERHTPPMELEVIAKALNVDPAWLKGQDSQVTPQLAGLLEQLLDGYAQATGQAPPRTGTTPDDKDQRSRAGQGADA